MKTLNLRLKSYSLDSREFHDEFNLFAGELIRCLSSNSIRGYFCRRGNLTSSLVASSFLSFFASSDINSSVYVYERKVGPKFEEFPFVVYRRHGGIDISFRNCYSIFVVITVYFDGDFSVHFLK